MSENDISDIRNDVIKDIQQSKQLISSLKTNIKELYNYSKEVSGVHSKESTKQSDSTSDLTQIQYTKEEKDKISDLQKKCNMVLLELKESSRNVFSNINTGYELEYSVRDETDEYMSKFMKIKHEVDSLKNGLLCLESYKLKMYSSLTLLPIEEYDKRLESDTKEFDTKNETISLEDNKNQTNDNSMNNTPIKNDSDHKNTIMLNKDINKDKIENIEENNNQPIKDDEDTEMKEIKNENTIDNNSQKQLSEYDISKIKLDKELQLRKRLMHDIDELQTYSTERQKTLKSQSTFINDLVKTDISQLKTKIVDIKGKLETKLQETSQ